MKVVFKVSGSSSLLSAMHQKKISDMKNPITHIVMTLNRVSIFSESQLSFATIYLRSSPNRAKAVKRELAVKNIEFCNSLRTLCLKLILWVWITMATSLFWISRTFELSSFGFGLLCISGNCLFVFWLWGAISDIAAGFTLTQAEPPLPPPGPPTPPKAL